MADTTLTIVFPEKQLQFEYNSFAGCFGYDDNPASFSAAIGETYRVMWGDDGVFDVTVFDASAVFPGALGMGNGTPFGFDGNGEPFVIVFIDGGILFLSLVDQVPTARSVSVHKVSDGSGGADSEGISVLPLASYEFVPRTNGDGETIYATILPLALEAWRKYRVIWDGMETVLTACAIQVDGIDELYLGNPSILSSFDDTGEPFFIFTDHAAGVGFIATVQEGESHTVGIWQTKDVGIVLRDHTGAEMGYYGVEGLHVDTTDGGTTLFVDADSVPESVETAVELDFSGGAMEVIPADGQAFSKVAVPVPENLLPENIAEGVNIAGIIGALVAGGGGGTKIAYGFYLPTGQAGVAETITHDLGVIPDIVYIGCPFALGKADSYLWLANGYSNAFYNAASESGVLGNKMKGWYCIRKDSDYSFSVNQIIDTTTSGDGIVNATTTTFDIGSATYPLSPSYKYAWYAIGGLT